MSSDDLERRVTRVGVETTALLGDIAALPDHRAGFQLASTLGESLRVLAKATSGVRLEHLDGVAESEEMDLATLAALAGGVTRQRASQIRQAARERRAKTTTGESA